MMVDQFIQKYQINYLWFDILRLGQVCPAGTADPTMAMALH